MPVAFVALLAFVICGAVASQAQQAKGGAVKLRERRASKPAADASAPAKAGASKGEPSAVEPAPKAVTPAEEASAAASAAEPGDEPAEAADADAPGDAGEVEALRAQINEAKAGAERSRLQLALASRLAGLGRKPEAVAALREMTGEERFDPPFFYNVGNALARLGESDAAADAYRKAVGQRRGNYARAQHNLGVVLTRLGRWEEAEGALKAALRLESNNYAEASYNLGRLYALRGEAGLAIQEWRHTLVLRPDHADAALALARALAEDGDPDAGLRLLDALGERYSRRGLEAPRAVAVTRGEIVAAVNVAERGEGSRDDAANSPDSERRAARGPSSLRVRSLAVARPSYDLLQRARAARARGGNEEAVALYRRVLAGQGGYFPPANLELGYALAALKRESEAVAVLRPVAEREGARYPFAFYHLGRFYEHLGEHALAAEAFGRAAALYGDANPTLLLDVSRAREKEGNAAAALEALESYLRAAERTGGAPDWVRERRDALRQKTAAAQPSTPDK